LSVSWQCTRVLIDVENIYVGFQGLEEGGLYDVKASFRSLHWRCVWLYWCVSRYILCGL